MRFRLLPALAILTLVFAQAANAHLQTPESGSVTINVLVLESNVQVDGDSCRPDTQGTTPTVRIRYGDRSTRVIGFKNAMMVDESNDVAPGESGCLAQSEFELDFNHSYKFEFDDDLVAVVAGSYLQEHQEFTLILDEDGPVTEAEEGVQIWAPTPTPTTAPVPTTSPAGDIGDGHYLLRGYLTLRSDNVVATDGICFGTGGYSDIGTGTQVAVRDGNNNVLGVGELEYSEDMTFGTGCTFMFEVEVEESRFYQIEMSHRGEMIFTFDDLEDDQWTVFLTLGR